MTNYWIYVDDVTDKVRIHKASSAFCNEGQGRRTTRLPDHANMRDTDICGHCLTDHPSEAQPTEIRYVVPFKKGTIYLTTQA